MGYKVVFIDDVEKELDKIINYIVYELDNVEAANNFLNEFYRKLDNIEVFPYSYPLISNKAFKEIRKYEVKNYLVYYCVEEEIITILSIRHINQKNNY